MSPETANLIVACASLVVMVVTLVVACVTLRFMVKNSKGYLRRKLREMSAERSYRYSPPHRGGYDDDVPPNQQPVGLQPNLHSYRVAALQAAPDGYKPETTGGCLGNRRVLPWAISVAALQAASINQNQILL